MVRGEEMMTVTPCQGERLCSGFILSKGSIWAKTGDPSVHISESHERWASIEWTGLLRVLRPETMHFPSASSEWGSG